jgi:uncharacterized caspase-like protein
MDSDVLRDVMTIGSQNPVPLRRRFQVAGLSFLLVMILSIGLVFHGAVLAADASKSRIAVVISNGDYSELGALRNPIADGQLVASALRNAGFNVKYLKNLKDEQFRAALRQVARDSAKADVTLVYYAGHGAQVGGTNYLLPVDISQPEQEDDIRLASVSADEVLSVIKSPYKILILDACRDNPILGRALSRGRSASFKSGLAPVTPPAEAAGGVFIAYSTQTNAIAIDGDGASSPFAESFAEHVGSHTSIDDMFALVTKDVLKKTNGFQRPFKYASLDTVFCLTGECPSGPEAVASGAALQTSLAFTKSVQDAFALLNAPKSKDARKQIEEKLWQQLRNTLPKRVSYGIVVDPQGKQTVYAFIPASAVSDTHHASVTFKQGEFKEGRVTLDEAGSAQLSLDCDSHKMVRTQTEYNGAVKLFSQAEQEAEMNTNDPGSVGASLERILCTSPLRITPLWAVDGLNWVSIGQGSGGLTFAAAPEISYRNPVDNAVRYLFVRSTGALSKNADSFGAELRYGWLEINCSTKQFAEAGTYLLTKNGTVIAVIGNQGALQPFADSSPASNGYVLLCDQPQGGK